MVGSRDDIACENLTESSDISFATGRDEFVDQASMNFLRFGSGSQYVFRFDPGGDVKVMETLRREKSDETGMPALALDRSLDEASGAATSRRAA